MIESYDNVELLLTEEPSRPPRREKKTENKVEK